MNGAWLPALCLTFLSIMMPPFHDATPMESYDERYRPQFHFTPATNFMNDPNGMVFYQGEYHLFYQHNPFGNEWGHMSWGHAVSSDAVHWKNLPVALREENGIMIFSGSAVVDRNNSSGLCAARAQSDKSCLIAIYTGHTEKNQTQNIAYSNDRGRTWTKYARNPVIDISERDFRDPKVIWHEATRQWVMVAVLAKDRKVRFYGSTNLRDWKHLSDFGPAGATGGIWECPDLFQLNVDGRQNASKWVLKVDLNPGSIAGGSGGQYFVGEFDGTKFTNANAPDQTLWIDYGKDFYAAQSWSNLPDADKSCVWLGWLNNWQYANKTPTAPWRGAQSIPRAATLRAYPEGVRLVQRPVSELRSLRAAHFSVKNESVTKANALLTAGNLSGDALEIIAEFEPGAASEFGFRVRKGAGEETTVAYSTAAQQLFVDRTKSGDVSFESNFPGRHAAPLPLEKNRVRLHIFVDRSSIEVFGNDGRAVITDLIFPKPDSRGIEVYATNGTAKLVSLDIWKLKSAWTKSE
ncbi:MAG: glycoside hydrolase family 32 protein [Acidobacteriota bacterium]|nr:glycoside hydrolase family 32 protein [Acidobacteriota bacterium]